MSRQPLASRLALAALMGATSLIVACGGSGDAQAAADKSKAGAAAGGPRQNQGQTEAQAQAKNGVHSVMDQGTVALQVNVPPGWKAESAVRWDDQNGHCSYAMASPMFRLTSPDGKASIEMLPGFLVSTYENDIRRRGSIPGDFCRIGMADSGEAFVRRIAMPYLRPQSRIQQVQQVQLSPDVAALNQRLQAGIMMPQMRVIPYQTETTLANPDGTMEKVTLGGVILASPSMLQGAPPLMLNQNTVAYAVRAPAERMAETEALAAQVRQSIRYNPTWKRAADDFANRATKPDAPRYTSNPSVGPGVAAKPSGPDWMDKSKSAWDAKQAGSDYDQATRVQTIREEQRCQLRDGSVIVVSIHQNCPSN